MSDPPIPALQTPTSFPFPYPSGPYSIQLDLMQAVFSTIESGQDQPTSSSPLTPTTTSSPPNNIASIGIFSSPTGTGKSLSLLTSTLTWLRANQSRLTQFKLEELEKKLLGENEGKDDPDPEWVIQHQLKTHLSNLKATEDERVEVMKKAREREEEVIKEVRRRKGFASGIKKRKLETPRDEERDDGGGGEDDDTSFLPTDSNTIGSHNDDPEDGISPEVRALMEQVEASNKPKHSSTSTQDSEETEPQQTKIFYTSRTHSQLKQLTSELLKTEFSKFLEVEEVEVGEVEVEDGDDNRVKNGYAGGKVKRDRKRSTEYIPISLDPSSSSTSSSKSNLNTKSTTNTNLNAQTQLILPIKSVPLAGRKQLCINPKIREIGEKFGDDRMNEGCLDLQKAKSDGGGLSGKDGRYKGRCEFLPLKEKEGMMLEFRDQILASVKDIEDIVEMGKVQHICPYYATRKSVKQAELVSLPYNLLLQKNSREALGIDLRGQVVVIDEAHNLIDTLLSIHSLALPLSHLQMAQHQLKTYHDRFKSRLKPIHALRVKQTVMILKGLVDACLDWAKPEEMVTKPIPIPTSNGYPKPKEKLLKANELIAMMSGSGDSVNLIELVGYLRESQLARKVSGYAEKVAVKAAQAAGFTSHLPMNTISAFRQVESFLLALTDANDDGRILLSLVPTTKVLGKQNQQQQSGQETIGHKITLRYMLLNPSEHFREVVEEARSVILVGGTMEPISDFLLQLFPSVPRNKISTLSCAHVIPKSNLLTQVVTHGPSKKEFEFKFDKRGDKDTLLELGALISSMINLIPDGVVVFLPSYAFLEKVKEVWGQSGLLTRLDVKKKVFYEPQSSGEVDEVLRLYATAISEAKLGETTPKRTGALLLAVVGAKLSEGINFSDALGRAVIMVGLPFANVGSVELKERMKYVETLEGAGKGAGQELYENLCMRAVNQSIGRAIRHANDYATLILVDKRYASPRISSKLPKWIGEDVKVGDFGDAVRGVAGFFKGKRGKM